MHGYTYKFQVNPVKQTIKLRPTMGTYIKALLPTMLIALLWSAVIFKQTEDLDSEMTDLMDSLDNEKE